MGVYYPGDGRVVYYGQDRINRIRELRHEAREHKRASDTYGSIGYKGHMVSEGQAAIRKMHEADRLELDGD